MEKFTGYVREPFFIMKQIKNGDYSITAIISLV